jgi:hypothetical protein
MTYVGYYAAPLSACPHFHDDVLLLLPHAVALLRLMTPTLSIGLFALAFSFETLFFRTFFCCTLFLFTLTPLALLGCSCFAFVLTITVWWRGDWGLWFCDGSGALQLDDKNMLRPRSKI